MRILSLAGLVLTASCGGEEPPPPDLQANKYTIWEIVEGFHRSGDQGDVDTMMTYLAPSASVYKGGEQFVRGRDNVEQLFIDRAEQIKGEGRTTLLGDKDINITGDMAVCTYIANVGTQRGAVTVIMRRSDKIWKIVHIHDNWPAKPPGE